MPPITDSGSTHPVCPNWLMGTMTEVRPPEILISPLRGCVVVDIFLKLGSMLKLTTVPMVLPGEVAVLGVTQSGADIIQ